MPQSPDPVQPRIAAASVERQVIMTIHPRAEAFTITIVTIILRTGYSTGFPGRIVAVPSATTGALHLHSATSGLTTIADLSSSVSAVTGRAIPTGDTTGTDGIPTAGTAIIPRIILSPATLTITIITTPHLRARS